MVTAIWVNSGSGNSLLPNSTNLYLNQSWLINKSFHWESPKSNFTGSSPELISSHVFRHYTFITTTASPKDNEFSYLCVQTDGSRASASGGITNLMLDCIGLAFNTLRLRRNEQHYADDILKRIFFNENVWISIKISPKFVPKGPINNIPALVQIMAWPRPGNKPLSEPMMVSLLTHICVTLPQWVKWSLPNWVWSHL